MATDKNPVDLWYVQNLDYVWILNWRSEMDVGIKTVQIIKEAAQRKKHHTIRPEPIDAQFDLVKGLYIPQQRVRLPLSSSFDIAKPCRLKTALIINKINILINKIK